MFQSTETYLSRNDYFPAHARWLFQDIRVALQRRHLCASRSANLAQVVVGKYARGVHVTLGYSWAQQWASASGCHGSTTAPHPTISGENKRCE